MFDIAWSKLMIIGVVALIVIGPKDLPAVLRTVGELVGKLRRMADEFRGQFNDAMREANFDDLKKDMTDLGDSVRSATSTDFNPIQTIRDEVKGAVEARNVGAATASGASEAEIAAKFAADAGIQDAHATAAINALPLPEAASPVVTEASPEPAKPAPRKRKPKAAVSGSDAA
jgi:sec-independent protein translocase protein TatB